MDTKGIRNFHLRHRRQMLRSFPEEPFLPSRNTFSAAQQRVFSLFYSLHDPIRLPEFLRQILLHLRVAGILQYY